SSRVLREPVLGESPTVPRQVLVALLRWRGRSQILRSERDLDFQLSDRLLDPQRAVAGLEAVDLVRLAQLAKAGEVVVDLADRAPRVVLAGQDQHRHADLLDVRQG